MTKIYLDDLKPEVAEELLDCFGFTEEEIKKLLSKVIEIPIGHLEAEGFDELREYIEDEKYDY